MAIYMVQPHALQLLSTMLKCGTVLDCVSPYSRPRKIYIQVLIPGACG